MATISWCVKCRKKQEMVNEKSTIFKNGVRALKGVCKVCGTGMVKILPKKPNV
jgi:hypothetical protein